VKLRLSALDLSPIPSGGDARVALERTLDLARLADRLGLTRYWLAEHHNAASLACPAPEILIGLVARETSRLRVGSGGVMLPNHAPLAVAERFRVLSALFPGRIDLGLGRAPGTDGRTARALRGLGPTDPVHVDDFPARLEDLFGFLWDDLPPDHRHAGVRAIPTGVAPPAPWILGSSAEGAEVAAKLGLPFAFARMLNPHEAVEHLVRYRRTFQPGPRSASRAPESLLAVSVVCAASDAEAERLAASNDLAGVRMAQGRRGEPFPSVEEALAYTYDADEESLRQLGRTRHVIGGIERVRRELTDLARAAEVDEIMVLASVHDHAARRRVYELLAEAFDVEPAA
jgi:luciferase family oxidoreductase group 1